MKTIIALFGAMPILLVVAGCSTTSSVTSSQTTGSVAPSGAQSPAAGTAGKWRGTRVTAGKAAKLYTLVSFDKNCNSVVPQITVNRQPTKGTVSFQPSKPTYVQYSNSGNCVGKTLPGMMVMYTAKAGMSGEDSFSIVARNAAGEIGRRDFAVRIEE